MREHTGLLYCQQCRQTVNKIILCLKICKQECHHESSANVEHEAK